jgi:starch synthase
MGDSGGFGIRFQHASVGDIAYSIERGVNVYADERQFNWMRKRMMLTDNSWDKSAQQYIDLYTKIIETFTLNSII